MAHRSVASTTTESSEPERPPPRLVLASEALREDVAPRHPGARVGRLVIAGVALSLGLLGLAMRHGADPTASGTGASVAFAAAGAVTALSALPFSYPVRAIATMLTGIFLMLLGVAGAGPLAGFALGGGEGESVARMVALGFLPGALLFRAHYRAYGRARWVVAVSLLAAAPFAAARGLVLGDAAAPLLERGGAALDLAAVLSGLFGFMGDDTTGGGSVWAALLLFVVPADVALPQLDRAHHHGQGALAHGLLIHGGAAVAVACAATLVALGAYHALSAWLGADARRAARAKASAESHAPAESPPLNAP